MAVDSTNVIVGAGVMYVAPIGTTLPTLDGTVGSIPIVWPAGWVAVGYTDDGVEFQYAPTFKDITVDEEMAPVKKQLNAEKCSFSVKLAEATLDNLKNSIMGCTLTTNVVPVHHLKTLKVGSSTANNEVMIGFQGPPPGTGAVTRVIIAYRAISVGSMALKMQRSDKVIYNAEFDALPDSTKPAGERLFEIVDYTS